MRIDARGAWTALQAAGVVALLAFWFIALRPQGLGGRAGYALVSGTSMLPTMHTGDVVIVHRAHHYVIGDVIAYKVPKGQTGAGAQVIHRIVGGNEHDGFIVQGDNRTAPDIWHPTPSLVVGREWAHIPKLGRVVTALHTPLVLAALAAAVAAGYVVTRSRGARSDV